MSDQRSISGHSRETPAPQRSERDESRSASDYQQLFHNLANAQMFLFEPSHPTLFPQFPWPEAPGFLSSAQLSMQSMETSSTHNDMSFVEQTLAHGIYRDPSIAFGGPGGFLPFEATPGEWQRGLSDLYPVFAARSNRPKPPPAQLQHYGIIPASDVSHDKCPICQESYDDSEHVAIRLQRVPCDHVFGRDCLQEWVNSGMDNAHHCPTCRQSLAGSLNASSNPSIGIAGAPRPSSFPPPNVAVPGQLNQAGNAPRNNHIRGPQEQNTSQLSMFNQEQDVREHRILEARLRARRQQRVASDARDRRAVTQDEQRREAPFFRDVQHRHGPQGHDIRERRTHEARSQARRLASDLRDRRMATADQPRREAPISREMQRQHGPLAHAQAGTLSSPTLPRLQEPMAYPNRMDEPRRAQLVATQHATHAAQQQEQGGFTTTQEARRQPIAQQQRLANFCPLTTQVLQNPGIWFDHYDNFLDAPFGIDNRFDTGLVGVVDAPVTTHDRLDGDLIDTLAADEDMPVDEVLQDLQDRLARRGLDIQDMGRRE